MGKIFSNLTKSGVSSPSGTEYYDSPEQASFGLEQSKAFNRDIPVSEPQLPNQIPSMAEGRDTQGGQQVFESPQSGVPFAQENLAAPAQKPAAVKPSFHDAGFDQYGNPNPRNAGLTKKGKLLSMLFAGATGAAAGAGARTFGEGFQTGMAVPFLRAQRVQQQRRGELEQQNLEQQIADHPFLTQERNARLDNVRADTKAKNSLAEHRNTDLAQTVEGRRTIIAQERESLGNSYSLTPQQEQAFILTGQVPGAPKPDNSVTAYEDFRKKYPQTPEGQSKAAVDWQKLGNKPDKPSASDKRDAAVADAEDIAASFLDQAQGDAEEALRLFTAASARVKNKKQLALAPKIRQAIRASQARY